MAFKPTHSRVLVWRSPCTVQCTYTTTHTEYVSAHHGGEASPLAHHEHVLVLGLRHVSRGQRSQTHQLIQTCTQRENVCLHHQIEKRNRYIIYIRSFGQLISSCIYTYTCMYKCTATVYSSRAVYVKRWYTVTTLDWTHYTESGMLESVCDYTRLSS